MKDTIIGVVGLIWGVIIWIGLSFVGLFLFGNWGFGIGGIIGYVVFMELFIFLFGSTGKRIPYIGSDKGRKKFKTLKGWIISYKLIGTGDTLIVLAHGMGSRMESWTPMIKEFESDIELNQKYTILVFDGLCCGNSSTPKGFLTIPLLSNVIWELIDWVWFARLGKEKVLWKCFDNKRALIKTVRHKWAFPSNYVSAQGIPNLNFKKIHLIGHSLSGATVLYLANQYPEYIETIILINPFHCLSKNWIGLLWMGPRFFWCCLKMVGLNCIGASKDQKINQIINTMHRGKLLPKNPKQRLQTYYKGITFNLKRFMKEIITVCWIPGMEYQIPRRFNPTASVGMPPNNFKVYIISALHDQGLPPMCAKTLYNEFIQKGYKKKKKHQLKWDQIKFGGHSINVEYPNVIWNRLKKFWAPRL